MQAEAFTSPRASGPVGGEGVENGPVVVGNGPVVVGPVDRGAVGVSAAGSEDLRRRLALALDFDDLVLAMRWASRLKVWFGVAKVGLELFSAAGPQVVAELLDAGFEVLVDMKLADIPTTTRKAARVLGALGATYLTVHTSAGLSVLRAGAEGLAEGADKAGLPSPAALGVTILTSEADAPADLLRARVAMAQEAGCGGVVCAAPDLVDVRTVAPSLFRVVPGIRPAGWGTDDQGRVATPAEAVRAGADLLVIGRAVTQVADPEPVAAAIMAEVAAVIAS
jgi:orotidine-5'-phosphate decarboxylase